MPIDRRIFLSQAAWAGLGAGAVLAGAAPARAIRIEEGDVAREAMVRETCETRQRHEAVRRALVAERAAQIGQEKAEAEIRQMACPFCGCPLAAED